MNDMICRAIGTIRVQGGLCMVELLPAYIPALKGLEEYGHLHLLWWFDGSDTPASRSRLLVKQPSGQAPGMMGVFATRTPHRPNPIALGTARILWVDHRNGRIRIDQTDARDGTPVLDIKPYAPGNDRVEHPTGPCWQRGWAKSYEESRAREKGE